MRAVLVIAAAEWRCWQRSRLAVGAAALLAALLLATTVLTTLRLQAVATERAHHQGQAEAAFLAQRVLMLAANPGRVQEIIPVSLPANRSLAIRETPEFVQLTARLRRVLEVC